MDELLKEFTSDDELRDVLQKPNANENYVYATNGHILIRVPVSQCKEKYKSNEKFPDCENIIKQALSNNALKSNVKIADLQKALDIVPRENVYEESYQDCVNCDGVGLIVCSECNGKYTCDECGGSGEILKKNSKVIGTRYKFGKWLKIGNDVFVPEYIERIYRVANYMHKKSVQLKYSAKCFEKLLVLINDIVIVLLPGRITTPESIVKSGIKL